MTHCTLLIEFFFLFELAEKATKYNETRTWNFFLHSVFHSKLCLRKKTV